MGAPLPYDKKTEDVVLGSVIHNPEDYDSVAKFFTNKDVFYQPRAQLLWEKITEMKREGQHIDTLTVLEDDFDKYEYIMSIGKNFTEFPEEQRIKKNFMHGCQSSVWLYGKEIDNKYYFT